MRVTSSLCLWLRPSTCSSRKFMVARKKFLYLQSTFEDCWCVWRRSTSADALIKQCHRIFVSLIQVYKKTYYGCIPSWPELSIDLVSDYVSHARESAKETWVIGQGWLILIWRNTSSLLIWCLHCLPWVWPCLSTNYTLSDSAAVFGGHSSA